MSSPEIASATKPSLGQDWLNALRYWLRGRRGVAAMIVSALVLGAGLNWSWLVAVGIAPVLLTALPCVAMCGLGLCMNRMTGGSCSTEARSVETPKPDAAAVVASLEGGEPGSALLPSDRSRPPDEPTASPAVSVTEARKPETKELT
jgi:hypothetical protein